MSDFYNLAVSPRAYYITREGGAKGDGDGDSFPIVLDSLESLIWILSSN